MKQQTSPQSPSLHQPSFKSYMENFMPRNASDLQKEQSSLSSFSNFSLGGCPPHLNVGQTDSLLHQAAKPNTMFASDMSGYQPAGISQSHSLLTPPLSNGHMVPGSPINPRVGKNFCPDSSSLPARGEYNLSMLLSPAKFPLAFCIWGIRKQCHVAKPFEFIPLLFDWKSNVWLAYSMFGASTHNFCRLTIIRLFFFVCACLPFHMCSHVLLGTQSFFVGCGVETVIVAWTLCCLSMLSPK